MICLIPRKRRFSSFVNNLERTNGQIDGRTDGPTDGRRMSQRCHKFSFVCHAQTSRDRRKRTTPRERAENLLQNCLFSKKSLITLRCRDFFKNKKPKALQFNGGHRGGCHRDVTNFLSCVTPKRVEIEENGQHHVKERKIYFKIALFQKKIWKTVDTVI